MAWGLEARVPFLDKSFLEIAMNVNPEEKMFNKGSEQEFDADGCPKMEKYIIRKAFDCAPDGKVRSFQISFTALLLLINNSAVPPPLNIVASEGAVLRWRRILLDRRVRFYFPSTNHKCSIADYLHSV